jgi:hypothetical protein
MTSNILVPFDSQWNLIWNPDDYWGYISDDNTELLPGVHFNIKQGKEITNYANPIVEELFALSKVKFQKKQPRWTTPFTIQGKFFVDLHPAFISGSFEPIILRKGDGKTYPMSHKEFSLLFNNFVIYKGSVQARFTFIEEMHWDNLPRYSLRVIL